MDQNAATGHQMPIEPLTVRELEILALIADGLSDKEIGDRVCLALTTVKWYNRQIYSKLHVNKRRDAVVFAQKLGILDTGPLPIHNLPAQTTRFVGRQAELVFKPNSFTIFR